MVTFQRPSSRGSGWCRSRRKNGARYGRAWLTMKWLTWNNALMRCRGESWSRYTACVCGWNVFCMARGQGIMSSFSFLHSIVTESYSVEEDVAFDARAADLMSYCTCKLCVTLTDGSGRVRTTFGAVM
jgi:hypothetical protein